MKELIAKQGNVTEEEFNEYYETHKKEIQERLSKELWQNIKQDNI